MIVPDIKQEDTAETISTELDLYNLNVEPICRVNYMDKNTTPTSPLVTKKEENAPNALSAASSDTTETDMLMVNSNKDAQRRGQKHKQGHSRDKQSTASTKSGDKRGWVCSVCHMRFSFQSGLHAGAYTCDTWQYMYYL